MVALGSAGGETLDWIERSHPDLLDCAAVFRIPVLGDGNPARVVLEELVHAAVQRIVVIAGLGGSTGTPVSVQMARELSDRARLIIVATTPFKFEPEARYIAATKARTILQHEPIDLRLAALDELLREKLSPVRAIESFREAVLEALETSGDV